MASIMPPIHTLWLAETRHAFRPACAESSTVWDRARAVTYLRERFIPRFRAERDGATGLAALLEPATHAALCAAGDLVEAQCEHLARLATFHQKAAEFSAEANELLLALEDWCGTLDAAADQVREADLRLV
jgi:hypothetical protein